MTNQIYRRLNSTPQMMSVFDDVCLVQMMLDFESALARALSRSGLFEKGVADLIASCCDVAKFDIPELSEKSVRSGTIVVPLVQQLSRLVEKVDPAASAWVHYGTTSQDVIDTALILQLKKALGLLETDAHRLLDSLEDLAKENKSTTMIGRTLMQPSVPITFGKKILGWRSAIARNWNRIEKTSKEAFVLQFGGAAGNLSAFGEESQKVTERCAELLKLGLPDGAWHVHRDRLVAFISSVALLVGSLGKMATDLTLLMQSEVKEISERYDSETGSSSAMPHKRNSVGCLTSLTAAKRVPHLLATLYGSMLHEHERALGGWQAEWMTIPSIIEAAAGSVAAMADLIERLEVNTIAMQENLDRLDGLVMSERVVLELSKKIGRNKASTIIIEACRQAVEQKINLSDVLKADDRVMNEFTADQIDELMAPEGYLGTPT